jgi:hypothetical protein
MTATPITAIPYPAGTPDDNANHSSIQAIADRVDTILSARTYAQINALAGTDLWDGRIQYQTDAGSAASPPTRGPIGLYARVGSAWRPVGGLSSDFKLATAPTLTAVTANPNMGTGPTQAWNWWMLGMYVIGWSYFKWGTGAPTTGTGALRVPVPLDMAADIQPGLGHGYALDSSTGNQVEVHMNPAAAGGLLCELWADAATSAATGASLVLGAAGDEIILEWLYEWSGS